MDFKQFPFKLFGFLILILTLQGCGPDKPGIYRNEQIKSGKRDDFHALNALLFDGLKANDAKRLGTIMAKEFIDDRSKFRTVELLSNRVKENNSYDLLDEFYIINDMKGHTISVNDRGINNYKVDYDTLSREMYIAFFVPKANANRWMITATYCKYEYGWKLNKLDINKYTINGKTAPELFKSAKEEYAKNYLVDATNAAELALDCLKPSTGWQYPEEKDVSKFYDQAKDRLDKKYDFPYALKQVNTQPQIFRVFNQNGPDGVFPIVYYLSDINLKDTVALKRENANIKKVIGNVMPGINKDKKYVFYSIFNQMPDGTRTFDHYDLTDKLQP
jgi:hypothetical protein